MLPQYHDDNFDADSAAQAVAGFLDQDDTASLSEWLRHARGADIADTLARLDAAAMATAFALIPRGEQAAIVGYLPMPRQVELVLDMPQSQAVRLLGRMPSDECADLVNALPESLREAFVPAMAQARRESIRKLINYPEGSVGAIMNSQYATLAPELSAAEAIDELRRIAPDAETIYNAYVVDDERHLIGVITLRRLILAPPGARLADLMQENPVSVHVDEPQYEAVEKIARYDFMALPVIDGERRIVGIVSADDAMDVADAEATEDFHKAGGSTGEPVLSMKNAGIALLYRKRVSWLVLLVFANIFSGAGIAYFDKLIAANIALVFFLPLLIDSGGNAGSQSATLMVRALATGDVVVRDWFAMLGRELLVAALLGLTMALAVSTIGVVRGGPAIAVVVALTMLVVVISGSLIGMSLPFLLSRLRADPASASAPLITTIADASGIVIYFGIASMLLPRLVTI